MTVNELAEGVLQNNRRMIAKALTLVESDRIEDVKDASKLLSILQKSDSKSRKIAISGTPGVGKSSFIEALGSKLIEAGSTIAVLAIDPTSPLSGGSILGDKTRMEFLSASEKAFVRPSPTKGALGGIARSTKDASIIFEAAGFDYIFIETVGVGQSETLAHAIVDCFVMLHLPNSGDDLQGIKKGINELADLIVIHKSDKNNLTLARAAKSDHLHASSFSKRNIPILLASSAEGTGLEEFQSEINKFFTDTKDKKSINSKRTLQNLFWFDEDLKHRIVSMMLSDPDLRKDIESNKLKLKNNELTASQAVNKTFDFFQKNL